MGARDAPSYSISFNFMQFLGEDGQNSRLVTHCLWNSGYETVQTNKQRQPPRPGHYIDQSVNKPLHTELIRG